MEVMVRNQRLLRPSQEVVQNTIRNIADSFPELSIGNIYSGSVLMLDDQRLEEATARLEYKETG